MDDKKLAEAVAKRLHDVPAATVQELAKDNDVAEEQVVRVLEEYEIGGGSAKHVGRDEAGGGRGGRVEQ